MKIRLVEAADAPLLEDEARFLAKSRVLEGIRQYDHRAAAGLLPEDAVAAHAARQAKYPSKGLSGQAEALLRIAWQMELTVRVGEQFDDAALRLASLAGLPVHGYYAVFNAARAFTHVSGNPKDTHAFVQAAYAAEHHRRAFGAWGVTLTGDPEVVSSCTLRPSICSPSPVDPLSSRYEPEEYVWAGLRMARRWRLERARTDWLKRHKNKQGNPYRRLPGGQGAVIAAGERCTTMMDLLYEMRCASNYRSVDEYAVDTDEAHVRRYDAGLRHLITQGLNLYEAQIAMYVSAASLQAVFEEWAKAVAKAGPWATDAPRARISALVAAGL